MPHAAQDTGVLVTQQNRKSFSWTILPDGFSTCIRKISFFGEERARSLGLRRKAITPLNDSLIESTISEIQNGDSDSFRTLYEHTSGYVYTIALRMLGQRGDAEEVMQETFITVFRKIRSFRRDSSFRTWLYRIVMRECFDRIRRRRRLSESMMPWSESTVDETGRLAISDVAQPNLLRTELKSRVEQALLSIHPDLRSTFVLRDIEGLSYSEIGNVLGCSVGTVSSRLARARKQLATQLTAVGIDETYFD